MMTHGFDKDYWEQHWQPGSSAAHGSLGAISPNPYLTRAASNLAPGTVLDAGCGAGAEAIWLAKAGWRVTAADISAEALALAADRAAASGVPDQVEWVEVDLSAWKPGRRFDLVTTHYAHPAMPQLEFYDRVADWVAPGGTLLIVGHRLGADPAGDGLHHGGRHGHSEEPPTEVLVDAAAITARLGNGWEVLLADEPDRTITGPDGHAVALYDVVVQAIRRG